MRVIRVALLVLAGLVVLAAIGVGVLVATFNPNAYKPRIAAAVQAATGRELALNGPIGLTLLPRPGITLRDVVLANPPGFASPRMASVSKITLQLDLGALLHRRVLVRQLVIEHPDITLERNKAGVPNWQVSAHAKPGAPAPAQTPQPQPAQQAAQFAVLNAELRDGSVTYRDDRTGKAEVLSVPHLTVSAASPDAPAHVAADMALAGTRFALRADTGPLTGLGAGDIWPVRANVTADGAGLHVVLDVTAPAADKSMDLAAKGTLRDTAFAAKTQLGAPSLLSGTAPYPISLSAQAAGAQFAAQGKIAKIAEMTGIDLALSVDVPDLAALSPLAGRPLPPLKALKATGRLSDQGGGFSKGVALRDLRIAAQPGDLAGTVEVAFAPRPTVHADLSGARLDLNALKAAAPVAPAPSPGKAPAPAPAGPGHVISDTPIPFASLRTADADLRVKVASLRAGSMTWGNTDTHVTLKNGGLGLSAHGTLDGKPVDLTATANANANPPAVAVALNAPALAVAPLLAILHQPAYATGNIAIAANMHGAGASPHAIAAGLDGFLAATMSGGTIDTELLDHMLPPVIARANLPGLLGKGKSEIRCLAARVTATHGKAALAPFLLSSPLITVDGTGHIDLAAETLDLQLSPQGRIGGTAFAVPVTVRGGFRNPQVAVADKQAAAAGLQAALGAFAKQSGADSPAAAGLQAVLGLLGGKRKTEAPAAGPSCPAALAAARR